MDFSDLNTYKMTYNMKNYDRLTPKLASGQQRADQSPQAKIFT